MFSFGRWEQALKNKNFWRQIGCLEIYVFRNLPGAVSVSTTPAELAGTALLLACSSLLPDPPIPQPTTARSEQK